MNAGSGPDIRASIAVNMGIIGGALILGALVISALVILIKFSVHVCNGLNSNSKSNVYERFETEDDQLAAIKKRIQGIQTIKENIQSDLDDLNDAADDTCNIMKQVEDSYIASVSVPSDDSETDLSVEMQRRRDADRNARAKRRFEGEKRMFVALHKQAPLLECFSASPDDVANAEQELRDQVDEMTLLLDNAEIKLAAEKGAKVNSLLAFNAQYLKKAVDAITVKEGFWSELRGAALLSKADELIGIALSFHESMQALKQSVSIQKKTAAALNKKKRELDQGNFAPSDIAHSAMATDLG